MPPGATPNVHSDDPGSHRGRDVVIDTIAHIRDLGSWSPTLSDQSFEESARWFLYAPPSRRPDKRRIRAQQLLRRGWCVADGSHQEPVVAHPPQARKGIRIEVHRR